MSLTADFFGVSTQGLILNHSMSGMGLSAVMQFTIFQSVGGFEVKTRCQCISLTDGHQANVHRGNCAANILYTYCAIKSSYPHKPFKCRLK